MRVARLEVFGFKSFMDRLVLPLDGGITGVVGPNGCGKSNIVDAIRWVLGETKASNLRGGTLEDVIFNGTDKLRPLGLAEVTLTLRAHEENFFADLISPQLEVENLLKNLEQAAPVEEAESEEVDASKAVKLRVIAGKLGTEELSEDGSDTDNIVEFDAELESDEVTDTIAEMIDDVSAEQGETEDQISTTILSRFSWLKAVSEVQITRRLYRSGESEFFINRVSCRLKDIKDFFRAVGLGARAYTIVAQGEVSRIVTSKPEERRLILEEAAGVVGFRDKIAASNRKLDETGHNITRLKDVIGEVDRQVSSLKRQAQRALNRQSLKDEVARLEKLVFTDRCVTYSQRKEGVEASIKAIAERIETTESLLKEIQLKEEACRNELSAFDVEGDGLRIKIDALREELLSRARQKSQRVARINEIRAFNLARGTEIRRMEERRETLRSRESEASKSLEEQKLKEKQLQEQINGVVLVSEEDLKQVASELRNARDKLKAKEGEIRIGRDKVVSSQSSLQAIQDQLIAASPINQLKKTLQADQVAKLVPQAKIFVEGLSVPTQYARAVQSILSERAAFLVTDAPQDIASAFLDQASKNDQDRKKGLGIGIFRSGVGKGVDEVLEVPFPSVLASITVTDAYAYAASRIFKNVFIAPSAQEAFKYFESATNADGVTLVTLDGDIITDYSFYSLRHDGGLIQLQNRANELRENLKSFEQLQETLTAEREILQGEVVVLENKQSEVLRESELKQRTLRDLSNQQATVRGRLQAEQRLFEQIAQDVEKIAVQIKDIEARIEEGKQEELKLQSEASEETTQEDSEIEAEVTKLTAQYVQVDSVRKEGRQKLSQFANEVHGVRKKLDEARAEAGKTELDLQKLDIEQDNIKTRVIAEYGEDVYLGMFEAADVSPLTEDQREEFEQEAIRIRNRIAREGEVDSTSIERYEEESTRLQDLEKQLADLENAATILKKTIVRLEEVSKDRFVKMFKAVSKNFSRLIPQLFGGGKGALELTDPSKPLESGIDIVMRPPGKKPKSIDLLSGGEKALCATALIFSMFLEKPSPLCVLDEVDAPLDEANLLRFLTLVKEMSAKTQFLIVTHNKMSMSMSDNLIGVTMQEPGASKVISVSLQEAYSQVA